MRAIDLPGEIVECESAGDVGTTVANWITSVSNRALENSGNFSIALAGGNTPKLAYEQLARPENSHNVRWNSWRVFFGDERACAPEDSHSNYRMAKATLLDRVPVLLDRVHRMEAERADLDAAALEYSRLLERKLPCGENGVPIFDCILLGLGENGHTASLFPGTAALQVNDAWATRGLADYAPFDRITLTYPVINSAKFVAFIVSGGSKGDALRGVINGTVPAAGVRPAPGRLLWFIDSAARNSI